MKLKNTNIIITGASHGFGKLVSERFLSEGANISICARNQEDLTNTQLELTCKFPNQKILKKSCDVSDESQVKDFIDYSIDEFKIIHGIVLNAGIYGPMGPIESISLTEWKRAIDINLFGVVLPCRSIIPHFKTNKSGKIIIISGGGATNPMPNISAYAASKAAVVRLTETISEELRGFGIDVNALAPGPMLTRLTEIVLNAGPETVGEEFFNRNKKWKEEGIDSSYQAADLAIYLIGSQSNGITGKLISAKWDNWKELDNHLKELNESDIYCLRRIVPTDRNKDWS